MSGALSGFWLKQSVSLAVVLLHAHVMLPALLVMGERMALEEGSL